MGQFNVILYMFVKEVVWCTLCPCWECVVGSVWLGVCGWECVLGSVCLPEYKNMPFFPCLLQVWECLLTQASMQCV